MPVPNLRQLLAEATAAAGKAEAPRAVGELCHGVEVVFSCPAFLTNTLLSGQVDAHVPMLDGFGVLCWV